MSNNDLTGQRIGRYAVRAHIGQGGMAEVYLAFDAELERNVALKLMLPGMTQEQKFVDRFRREARTAARLNHPNIVQVYDVGTAPDGRPYIAMQYVDGGSLRATLTELAERGKLLPTDQALAIVRQVADALAVAHRAGIVHRDLKPSNILIRADGTPVVVDLGIAAVQGGPRLTQTGNLIGTPHYMSPEQVKGEPIDGRSDLYSLGVILYELLAGVRPFTAEESIAILHAHVYESPPPLDGLRADLAPQTVQIVHTLLRKSPDERYATAEQLIGAIDQALLAEGSSAQAARTTVVLTQISDSDLVSRQVVHLPQEQAARPATPPSGSRQPPPPPVYTPSVATQPQRSGPSWALVGAIALIALLAIVIVVLLFQVLRPPDGSAVASVPPAVTVKVTATVDLGVVGTQPEDTPLPSPPAEPTSEPTEPPAPTDPPLPTDTPEPSPTAMPDLGPELIEIARSVEGASVNVVRFGDGANSLVMVGGINAGFAPSGVSLAQRAIDYFADNLDVIPANITLYIVDSLNPDATYDPGNLPGRFNANGVDLNRNWDCNWSRPRILGREVSGGGGTRPLSEPETRGLHDFIMEVNPVAVVFWTARATNGWSSPGSCGVRTASSGELAAVYGFAAGYEVVDYENETDTLLNGDATNYLDQVGIPAISVLLPTYTDPDWPSNREAITAVMDFYNNR